MFKFKRVGLIGLLLVSSVQAQVGGGIYSPYIPNPVPLSYLATEATNTIVGNATSGTAVPTALPIGTCATAASALRWTTNTGFDCNTNITANTATTATTATNLSGGTVAATTISASSTTALTGNLTVGGTTVANPQIIINGTLASSKFLIFQSAGTTRWLNYSEATTNDLVLDSSSLSNVFRFTLVGVPTFGGLAGTGSRAVLADANGVLSAPVSDELLKQNIEDIPYGLWTIMKLTPKIWDYINHKSYGSQKYIGFGARETAQILPEVTGQDRNGIYYLTDEKVTAVLVKAVQQLTIMLVITMLFVVILGVICYKRRIV